MAFISLVDQMQVIKDQTNAGLDKAGTAVATYGKNTLERKITSLAQFTRPSLIESPCFIHSAVVEEPAVNDTIKCLYNIYIGYILVALQMNDLVVGNRRVRDILETVSTQGTWESFIDNTQLISGLIGSLEDFVVGKKVRGIDVESKWDEYETMPHPTDPDKFVLRTDPKGNPIKKASLKLNGPSSNYHTDKIISLPIAAGRQVEVQFATDKGNPISVMINVKFNPRVIPDAVVEYILSPDYTNSMSNRWIQYQAGEIRFFKDFVLGIDKLNRKEKALKADKDNALQDIFRHQNRGKFEKMAKAAGQSNSHNLANSILILEADTATRYMKKSGFSFDKLADRQRFFNSTFNLFIVLVDTRYSRVTIYTNGIDQSSSYSFNELKSAGSSDKMSLKDIMDFLAKSQMPKF